jgi:hypothetical protein
MSNSIHWSLVDIYPTYADLLSTLDCLFGQYPHLRRSYRTAHRYYKGQRARFAQRDRRSHAKWQAHTATRLFTLGRQQIELAVFLRKHEFKNAWLLQNCIPSGGHWTGSAHVDIHNPTGKQCDQSLCIWCWMRRLDDLSSILKSTSMVTTRSKMKNSQGLGFKGTVCVSCFTSTNEQVTTDPLYRREFMSRITRFIRHPPKDSSFVGDQTQRAHEFYTGLRVTTPVQVKHAGLQLQVSYIHQGTLFKPTGYSLERESCSGAILFNRYVGVKLWDALRFAYPFPCWIYDQQLSLESIRQFFQATHHLKMYGVNCLAPKSLSSTQLCICEANDCFAGSHI